MSLSGVLRPVRRSASFRNFTCLCRASAASVTLARLSADPTAEGFNVKVSLCRTRCEGLLRGTGFTRPTRSVPRHLGSSAGGVSMLP